MLFVAALLCYFYIAMWLWRGWRRLSSATGQARPAISVVIAVHNEEEHLPALLAALEKQRYPKELCEFIVIDDRSNDGTGALLEAWQPRLRLRVMRIDAVPGMINPKKFALTSGIREARGEVIVTTDGDCIPPPQWLESIASVFADDVGAVVGLSPWHAPGRLWGKIVALESYATAIVALAGVGNERPFLAVGRNFAFRRELFERVGGFAGDMHIFSGDDDLLLQKISALPGVRVAAVYTDASQVPSRGADNLLAFLRQKRRHISASKAYARRQQIGYALHHVSNVALWSAPLFLGWAGGGLLSLKFLVDGLIFRQAMRRCQLPFFWTAFLPWQVLFLLVHVAVGPLAFVGRIRWKS